MVKIFRKSLYRMWGTFLISKRDNAVSDLKKNNFFFDQDLINQKKIAIEFACFVLKNFRFKIVEDEKRSKKF